MNPWLSTVRGTIDLLFDPMPGLEGYSAYYVSKLRTKKHLGCIIEGTSEKKHRVNVPDSLSCYVGHRCYQLAADWPDEGWFSDGIIPKRADDYVSSVTRTAQLEDRRVSCPLCEITFSLRVLKDGRQPICRITQVGEPRVRTAQQSVCISWYRRRANFAV